MAVTNFSPLLGLALPTTGDLSGTWGTTVNDSITSLLDSAVAGTTTLSTDTNVTLSTTNGAANQARSAVLLCTGARTALRTITAPAQSKAYVVINQTTGGFGVQVVGAGPTTGVTIANGDKALIAWNGSDFTVISSTSISNLTGTLPVTSGGTGQTTYTNGQLLIGNTTGNTLTKATLTAGSGISVTNGAGSITIAATGGTGTVTSVATSNGPAPINGLTLTGGPITSSGTVTLGGGVNVSTITTGVLPVANGGTGLNAVGSNGNVLTSNGTAWVSQAVSASAANIQTFSAGGTYTKPPGAKFIYVEMWGAGGGGGGGFTPGPLPSNALTQNSGGGGGAYTYKTFAAPEVGGTVTVTVGAGGAGGLAGAQTPPSWPVVGQRGGTTNFGTLLYAYGGYGGATNTTTGGGGGVYALNLSAATINQSNPNTSFYRMVAFGAGISQPGTSSVGAFGSGVWAGGSGGVGNTNSDTNTRAGNVSMFGGGGGGGGSGTGGGPPLDGGNGGQGRFFGGSPTVAQTTAAIVDGIPNPVVGSGGGAGGAAGTPGSNGNNFNGGGGGGGAPPSNTTAFGSGGNGGIAGGGGGGGGTQTGPAVPAPGGGGAGGNGYVVVYTWS